MKMSSSNTFGGTIKLEGEKEYRKAISQINSDLKVLASEMGKVTAEFGKNNKSVSSLSSKSKVLNEQNKLYERTPGQNWRMVAKYYEQNQRIFHKCGKYSKNQNK